LPATAEVVRELDLIAKSLRSRVSSLEKVPCVGKYTTEAFNIFCLGQWKTTQPSSFDLQTYVKWRATC